MKFTPKQINELYDIVKLNHIIYISEVVGVDILTTEDKKILKRFGVSEDTLEVAYTDTEQAFYWGRLSQALKTKAKNVTYNDFTEYLKRGQYTPLNQTEKYALKYVKQNTYNHIKGLGDKVTQDINGIVIKNDPTLRASYEGVIRDALERGIIERQSLQNIVSEIGHKTGDWERNLWRIVDTEMQSAFQLGRAEQIKREQGNESLVYKEVFPQACKHCIKLYLTEGIGSKPITFKLNELMANGTNIGLKPTDWKPVVGVVHPFCRCELHSVPEGYIWNEEKGIFTPPQRDTSVKLGYKITVGDKVFEV